MNRMINEALETMRGLHDISAVNKQTLRDFETQCLPPPIYTAEKDSALAREATHQPRSICRLP